jgi:hypothetical protein
MFSLSVDAIGMADIKKNGRVSAVICSRCSKHATIHLTSIMNGDEICLSCKAEERQHPLYTDAQLEEELALQQDDTGFQGLFPDKSWVQIKELHPVAQR